MKFVIAGTRAEADEWIRKDMERRSILREVISMKDYIILDNVNRLRGIQNPHGVFVGNWLGRPDIFHIVEALMLASTHVNKALGKIYGDLKPLVRPTPKLKPVSGGWINEELVKQFNGGDMTNRYKEVRKALDTL
jgi:hypothetical protein